MFLVCSEIKDTGKGFTELSNVQSTEYSYDKNGNLTKDLNKGLGEIAYNCLNLPKRVVKGGQTIRYIYSATGEKLQNILPNKTITYNGGFVYEDGALQYILNEEGRYNVSGVNAGYEYNLKDHLGNVRMVINSSGSLRQSNNYYPFGGIFDQFSSTDNKYQYGGKELQEETDWLDFGARMYDSGIGRWLCFDPMAEKAANWTPYRYCFNNPMNVTDPTGLYEWDYDMGTSFLNFVGFKGGASTQYVNNFSGATYLNTAIMENSVFENFFGFKPSKERLGDDVPIVNDTYMYDNLVVVDRALYDLNDGYSGKYSIPEYGDVSFQHTYTRGWYMSYTAKMVDVKSYGSFNIHAADGSILYSYAALSGSHNKFRTIPEGSVMVKGMGAMDVIDSRFMLDGEGFKGIIMGGVWDPVLGRLRTLLRVHPCVVGTEGCIGVRFPDIRNRSNDIQYLDVLFNILGADDHTTIKIKYD